MKLSYLFSDGMVLQRGKRNYILGETSPEIIVTGILDGRKFNTKADTHGMFVAELPDLPVGGPYCMEINGDEKRVIRNIMSGDVFLLGGQSNMELRIKFVTERFADEIKKINDSFIRKFDVPKEYDFGEKRQWLSQGRWESAQGESVLEFSALGLFMALSLREKNDVPVGLIQTAVEGTPVKAWCSEETIRHMGFYTDELEKCKNEDYVLCTQKIEIEREKYWMKKADQSFDQRTDSFYKISIPGIWKGNMRDFCGTVLLEKKFFITEEQAVTPAEILMGAFTDADKIYINGICCGSSYDRYAPRIYPVAPGILRAGENVVCIHLYVFRGRGGAMPGKQYGIRFKKGKERWLDLSGTWDAQIRKQMEYLPEKTFFNYMASAMFNGMISPVSPYKICAVIYYQGESDVGHPNRYALEFRALVNDWRKSWKEKQLPIIYVQLAGFSDGNIKKQGTQWAEFREVQRQAMEIENTAMIQAYDVGEYNDLHPMDKKTLGMRAALAVHKLVYGEKEECTGPQVRKIRLDRDKRVHAVFDQPLQTGSKKDGCELVSEVELRKANGDYKRAYVTVDGNEICAWLSDGEEPTGIRYAWKDCPMNICLYGKKGLPVIPFIKEWGRDAIYTGKICETYR